MKSCFGFLFAVLFVLSCNEGLEPPPPPPPTGVLLGEVHYSGRWPSADSLREIRFVAMRLIPRAISDFTDLNNIEFSGGLRRNVDTDTFSIRRLPNGLYPYSGVAWRYGPNVFMDWKPVGLYSDPLGRGLDIRGDTVRVLIRVDFGNLPPFPPSGKAI